MPTRFRCTAKPATISATISLVAGQRTGNATHAYVSANSLDVRGGDGIDMLTLSLAANAFDHQTVDSAAAAAHIGSQEGQTQNILTLDGGGGHGRGAGVA